MQSPIILSIRHAETETYSIPGYHIIPGTPTPSDPIPADYQRIAALRHVPGHSPNNSQGIVDSADKDRQSSEPVPPNPTAQEASQVSTQIKLQVETFVEPSFQENAYLLYCHQGGSCWIVDPSFPPQTQHIAHAVERARLKPSAIMLTHGHADHLAGVGSLKQLWPDAAVRIGQPDQAMLNDPQQNLSAQFGLPVLAGAQPDGDLCPQQELELDGLLWRVLDTSGHSPGSRSLYCPTQHVVITGDALFAGSIGRTDLPGASHSQLLENIRAQLMSLPAQTRVLPGHGPATTIDQERRSNPFLADGA